MSEMAGMLSVKEARTADALHRACMCAAMQHVSRGEMLHSSRSIPAPQQSAQCVCLMNLQAEGKGLAGP